MRRRLLALATCIVVLVLNPFGNPSDREGVHAQSVGPSLTVSPVAGPPGTVVNLSATGFPILDAGSNAMLSFDGTVLGTVPLVQCTDPLNGSGFGDRCGPDLFQIRINATQIGSHTITVQDGALQTSTTFIVTAAGSTPTITATVTPTPDAGSPTITPTSGTASPTATTIPPPPGATATDTVVATSTAVPTPTTAGGPNPPTCPATNTGLDAAGHLQGGSAVTLARTGLPANTVVRLFYDGPRRDVRGTVSRAVTQTASLGTATVGADGALAVTVHLPLDVAAGTAKVLAFPETGGRIAPLTSWNETVSPRAPMLLVRGTPGQQVAIAPGDAGPTASSSCTLILDNNGVGMSLVAAGDNTVTFTDSFGTPTTDGLVVAPGSTATFSTLMEGGRTHLPVLVCPTDLQIFSAVDLYSGGNAALTGAGPLGTFLTGVPVDDTVLVDVFSPTLTAAGGTLDPVCVSRLTGTLRTRGSEDVLQTVEAAAPANADAYSALVQQATASLDLPSTPRLFAPGSEAFILSGLHLGNLPPTGAVFRISAPGLQRDLPVDMVDPGWAGGGYRQTGTAPAFDPASRTYHATGRLPSDPVERVLDLVVSWAQYSSNNQTVIPATDLTEPVRGDGVIALDERFNTQGNWTDSSATGTASLAMAGQTLLANRAFALNPFYHGALRPDYAVQVPPFVTGPAPALSRLSVPVAGFRVPLIDRILNFRLEGVPAAATRVSATLGTGQNLSRLDVLLNGSMRLGLRAGTLAPTDLPGVELGLSLDQTLQAAVDAGAAPPGTACAQGTVRFSARYAVDNWKAESHDLSRYGPATLAGIHAGTCPATVLDPPPSPAPSTALRHTFRAADLPAAPPAQTSTLAATPHPATPSVAVGPDGRGMAVWVNSDPAQRRDTLRVATTTSDGWSDPRTIASSNQAILQPQVAHLGDGRALAVWIENTLSNGTVRALPAHLGAYQIDRVMGGQEVFWSLYAGGRWSSPHRMTRDGTVDADPTLAVNPTRHTGLLVWSRVDVGGENSLGATVFDGRSWIKPVTVPGSTGVLARRPFLTARPDGGYALAWIGGPYTHGVAHVVGFKGERLLPPFNGNVTAVTVAPEGSSIAVAASLQPLHGNAVVVGEPAIWGAVQSGAGWKVARVTANGDTPHLSSDGGTHTVLTYTQPQLSSETARLSQIGYAVAGPTGFSAAGSITRDTAQSGDAATAVDPRAGSLRLIFQQQPLQADLVLRHDRTWARALHPDTTTLDPGINLVQARIPLKGKVVADLAHAQLSTAHPAPGEQVSLRVPLYNVGLSAGAPSGRIVAQSGATTLVTLRPSMTVAPNGNVVAGGKLTVHQKVITLHARQFPATAGVDLGGPKLPVGVSTGTDQEGNPVVQWRDAGDHDIVEYRIYRGDGEGRTFTHAQLVGIAHGTNFVDVGTSLSGGTRYAVTAVDAQGRESAYAGLDELLPPLEFRG